MYSEPPLVHPVGVAEHITTQSVAIFWKSRRPFWMSSARYRNIVEIMMTKMEPLICRWYRNLKGEHSLVMHVTMALCKNTVTLLLTNWSYYRLALSHRYMPRWTRTALRHAIAWCRTGGFFYLQKLTKPESKLRAWLSNQIHVKQMNSCIP